MKVIRVTFRNGEQLLQTLPEGVSVTDWVNRVRIDGVILGESWGAKWDDVAHWQHIADDVPTNAKRPEAAPGPTFGPIDRLAVVTGSGIFKPPGDA